MASANAIFTFDFSLMGVTSFRGNFQFLPDIDDRGLQAVQLYDLGVSGSAAEIFLSDVPQGIALLHSVGDVFGFGCRDQLEVVHSYPRHDTGYDAAALLGDLFAEQDT